MFYWFKVWVALVFGGLVISQIEAKIYPYPYPVDFRQTAFTQGFEVLLSLNGYWHTPGGLAYPVPFISNQHRYLELRSTISLPNQAPDTVFFYTEGISPSFSIYLDDRLLYYSSHPRKAIWLPVPKKLFQKETTLRVVLQQEDTLGRCWLGLHQPVYLLKRIVAPDTTAARQEFTYLPLTTAQDSIILFSTVNDIYGPYPDTLWFKNHLSSLKQAGYNSIYFTDFLDNFLWPIITQTELKVVLGFPKTAKVARLFYHQDSSRSWLNPKEQKTIYWGKFTSQQAEEPAAVAANLPPPKGVYFTLLAIFLAIITILRLSFIRIFTTLQNILVTPKELYSQLLDAQKLRSNKIIFFSIAKIPLAVMGLWLIQEQLSARFGLLTWSYPAAFLWPTLLIGYAAYYGFKFAWIFFLASVYRQRNLGQMGVGLDLAAGFVTWELMLFAALLSYVVAEKAQFLLILVWAALLTLHIIRRIYLINSVLSNYFQLGYLARMLYFCALEFLPWVLLFTIR